MKSLLENVILSLSKDKLTMTKILHGCFLIVLLASLFVSPLAAYAEEEAPSRVINSNEDSRGPPKLPCNRKLSLPCISDENQRNVSGFITGTIAARLFRTMLGFVAVISVIFLMVGGMQMHLAMGNEEAITKAKKTVIWALLGLVAAILAVAAVKIIANLPY